MLLIIAATFVVGFVIVALLVHSQGIVAEEDEGHAFGAVYRFLSSDPLLRPWSAVLILGDALWLALFAALPVLVLERFGDQRYVGLAFAGFGGGAIVGGVIAFKVIGTADRIQLASLGEIGMALPLWLLLVHASPLLLVAAFGVAGFANGLVNALHTIVQLRTPRQLRTALRRGHHRHVGAQSSRTRLHRACPRAVRRRPDRCRDPRLPDPSRPTPFRRRRTALQGHGTPRARVRGVALDTGVGNGLVVAESISMAGSQMTYIVLPWFVLTTTGSPARTSRSSSRRRWRRSHCSGSRAAR